MQSLKDFNFAKFTSFGSDGVNLQYLHYELLQ